jgi:hypothetical protein
MADSTHTQILGVYENLNPVSPCVPASGPGTSSFWQIVTWGPAVTMISASISAGAPADGCSPFVCPGASSTLFVVGTPSELGVFNFTIDALLSNGTHLFVTCEQTVTLAGPPAGPGGAGCSLITLSPASPLDDVFRLEPISIAFGATGGTAPYTWDLAEGSELPDGLELSSAGVLSGAATIVGDYTFTIRTLDADGCRGIAKYDLTVVEPDPIVVHPDDPDLAEGRRGWLYVQIFTATGGIGEPYEFTLPYSEDEIPPGMTFSALGVLAGLPTAAGLYVFTVRATDEAGYFGEREYTLRISGLRIEVGGVDRTIDIAAAEIELTLNRQATARLEFGDEEIPARGVDVLIYARDGITPIFGGLSLVRRVAGMTASSPANKIDVDCVDYSIYFDDADPVSIVSTVSQDLEDVITSIVSQSLAVYGITYDAAPTGKTVPPVQWTEITVADAFKRITDATGVVFRVLPLKALDVFVPLDDAAPVTITDAEINAFDLQWQDPPNLPRNTVDLLCGPTGTAIVTQDWTADGIATSFEVDIQAVIGDYWPGARSHAFLGPNGAGNFSDGDTITLGSSTYTMRTALVGDVAGEVLIGADVNASLANLVAAIIGAGGGVYAPSTPVNTDADAFMRYPDQLAVNALTVGVAGDSIAVASSHGAIASWYGEGGIPLDHLQLGSDPSGAAGWTQGYILENGATAVPLEAGQYSWNVSAGRGTITAVVAPPDGTTLELRYLAVMPFHVKYPTSLGPGVAPITFREAHPEIDNYASGLALAQQIYNRESNDRRELEISTDVDGFFPGQDLSIDTTYRGGIVDDFLVAAVRIKLVNAELWEYSITAQEADLYAGSFVEQWKALTSGGGGSSSSTAPAPVVPGDVSAAGDVYTDGRNAFRSDQSLGGHKLRFVDDPASAQDAATKAYVDAGDASTLSTAEGYADTGDASTLATVAAAGYVKADGSVDFTGPQSMGGNAITDLDDPTNAQDAATKAYVDAGGGGGGSGDQGFAVAANGLYTIVSNPMIVKPTGTTLTFIVAIGAIGVNDATVYANVALTDIAADDAVAVVGNSLVSFGGQHLFGIVHLTGLEADKEYLAVLVYSSRRATAAVGGGAYQTLICLDKVTAIDAASLETAEAASSSSFGDLATAGPSATLTPPASGIAALIFGDSENRVQTGTSMLGIDISGGNTFAATAFGDLVANSTNGAQNLTIQGALVKAGLAASSTTFKLQYRSDGGSNTRYARWIAALAANFGDTPITFGISRVLTAETRNNTAYGALTTADTVTITVNTKVLVLFSVNIKGSTALDASIAIDVSGANTIAAADGTSNAKQICSSTASALWHIGRGKVFTGLTPGSTTFALRYKASTGTVTAQTRILAVIPLD